jgi:hypothetical protein
VAHADLLHAVLDALIVGMDMLINKQGKYDKRIFLVTDGGDEVNTDGLDLVLQQFQRMSAKLNIMYAPPTHAGACVCQRLIDRSVGWLVC